MKNKFEMIRKLLKMRSRYQTILDLTPYDGSIEIKEISDKKYLYIRKREEGKKVSLYVGPYSNESYQNLLKEIEDAKAIKKAIKAINKELLINGYTDKEIPFNVSKNIDYVQNNLKFIVYNLATLEGVKITFSSVEQLLDNKTLKNITFEDAVKVLNIKHAWEMILDKELINVDLNFEVYQSIANSINIDIYQESDPQIGNFPNSKNLFDLEFDTENSFKEEIERIIRSDKDSLEIAIELLLCALKAKKLDNANKSIAFIFANRYLISHGAGLLIVPKKLESEFKKLLNKYLEELDTNSIKEFLRTKCFVNMD